MLPNALYLERKLEVINADVTNHCNARCFFCFNDWAAFQPHNMTLETFQNLMKLYPLLRNSDYMISCWFEPTLNPKFFDMLDMLTPEFRKAAYFTTNFVAEISDENMIRMCRANLHHINVSIESFDEKEYQHITGVKHTHFFENLERFAAYSKQYNTHVQVITMLTKRNMNSLPELVRRTNELLSPVFHEIRTPHFFREDTGTKEALIRDMLTEEEICAVRSATEKLGYSNLFWDVSFTKESFSSMEKTRASIPASNHDIFYHLRVNSDGTARLGDQKNGRLIDINAPGDLVARVKQEIYEMEIQEAELDRISDAGMHFRRLPSEAPYGIDAVRVYDERILFIRGYDRGLKYAVSRGLEVVALMECGEEKTLFKQSQKNRKESAMAQFADKYWEYCFLALFDLKGCSDKPFTISLGYLENGEVVLIRDLYEYDPGACLS